MSQEYTPVDWVDETTSQQGTLINAARLDQMQTAHHYADGFEEVDAVPTADPGVDYHKVVFCTTDTTFYRWDGSQWVKDVDDTTAAELAAHEADHDNPHQVTKGQVGLGNVDNTSDLNKPVSGPQQTALNAKADKTQLSDGSVTKVGTATVGAINKPIFLDAGVPTEGFMPVYSVNGADGPAVALDGSGIPWTNTQSAPKIDAKFGYVDDALDYLNTHAVQYDENGDIIGNIGAMNVVGALTVNGADLTVAEDSGTGGGITAKTLDTTGNATIGGTLAVTGAITGSLTGPATKLGTTNVGTDTKPIKLVAGVATPVTYDLVDTNSAQTIEGVKTFSSNLTIYKGTPIMRLKDSVAETASAPASNRYLAIDFRDKNDALEASIALGHYPNGNKDLYFQVKPQTGSDVIMHLNALADGTGYLTAPARAYNASNVNDVATISTLDAYSPMVRTSGNQLIGGIKTFTYQAWFNNSIRCDPAANVRRGMVLLTYSDHSELYFAGNVADTGPFLITHVPSNTTLLQADNARLWTGTKPTDATSAIRNIIILTSAPSGGQDGDIAIVVNDGIYCRSSGAWSKIL